MGGECWLKNARPALLHSTTRQFSSSDVPPNDIDLALGAVDQQQQSQAVDTIPGSQTGGKKMAIVFTCKVCDTRSAKQFTERAYTHGVVIVKCPQCLNQHLIADRLGFFEDESWDIETAVKSAGEKFTAVTNVNVLELTMKDILGDKYDEALRVVGHDVTALGHDEAVLKNDKKGGLDGKR